MSSFRNVTPASLPSLLLATLFLAFTLSASSQEPADIQPVNVVEAPISDLQSAILNGATSCRAVVQAYLDRIEAYDQATGLNAITVINSHALSRADAIDQMLALEEDPGSLFCAPILVKDNFDTYDLPTTGGSIALAGSIPPCSAA